MGKICKECGRPNPFPRQGHCSLECFKLIQEKKALAKVAKKKREKWVKARGVTDEKCNKLWSQIVRSPGKCEYCGKTEHLQAHHIFGRSNKAVLWDVDNGVCLCAGCHKFSRIFSAHETPTEFTIWLFEYKGDIFMENLRAKARVITKPDIDAVYKTLCDIAKK